MAMSFEPRFVARFEKIIRPAIEDEPIFGLNLKAYRVDNSKTGDSILTDIVDNIAHSKLVLADVSVIDEGRYTQIPIRNGNVMYEVGVALSCRNPSEVLLIRDDKKKFLFDVSTIPHLEIDFSDAIKAIDTLRSAISDRIMESDLIHDARIELAVKQLTQDEIHVLDRLSLLENDQAADLSLNFGRLSFPIEFAITRLLQKGCIESAAMNEETGSVYYALTSFGYSLAKAMDKNLGKVRIAKETAGEAKTKEDP